VDVNTSDPATSKAAIRFNITMIPASFFFDGEGRLVTHFRGIKTHEQLADMLTEAGYPVKAPAPKAVQVGTKAGSGKSAPPPPPGP
jgi:thioredoxin-like negative regulator of GroEL